MILVVWWNMWVAISVLKSTFQKVDVTFPFLPLTTVISFQLLCLCICLMHIVEISQRLDHCLSSRALKHFIHHACYCTVVETHLKEKIIASAVIGNVQWNKRLRKWHKACTHVYSEIYPAIYTSKICPQNLHSD